MKMVYQCEYCGEIFEKRDYDHEEECKAIKALRDCLVAIGHPRMADAIGLPLITAIKASILMSGAIFTAKEPDEAVAFMNDCLLKNKEGESDEI